MPKLLGTDKGASTKPTLKPPFAPQTLCPSSMYAVTFAVIYTWLSYVVMFGAYIIMCTRRTQTQNVLFNKVFASLFDNNLKLRDMTSHTAAPAHLINKYTLRPTLLNTLNTKHAWMCSLPSAPSCRAGVSNSNSCVLGHGKQSGTMSEPFSLLF